MIDLHAHLLPGIDDGPPDIEGSLALARASAAQGVHTMAATPHCRADHPEVLPAELAARTDEVRARLQADGVELAVVQAGEVALGWATDAADEDLRLVSYGARGSDLLVETPFAPLSHAFEAMLEGVIARGYRILLAHPENNPTFQHDPSRLRNLVTRGVLVQVTARSLVRGGRRSRARALARELVRSGTAHVIASDAHSAGSFRPPRLAEGLEAAAELVGAARAAWMVAEAPAALLGGVPLPAAPPLEPPQPPRRRLRLPLRRR